MQIQCNTKTPTVNPSFPHAISLLNQGVK